MTFEPRNFTDDLAQVQTGWSPRVPIMDRAFMILAGAENAAELADEIEALQVAEVGHYGLGNPPVWATHIWRLKPEPWARSLAAGAWRAGRLFWGTENAPHCVLRGAFFSDLERVRAIIEIERAA